MERNLKLVTAILGFFLGITSLALRAEPWLGNRFAQNCAGCHAPGRKNVPTTQRRCTLSCQGCHVNPNGGGLRSFYGKWNEDRWLKSFRTDVLGNAKSTAPYIKQNYATLPTKKDSPQHTKRKVLVTSDATAVDEAEYDREDGLEYIVSQDRKEFLAQIPFEDPYYLTERSKLTAGADVRWQLQQLKFKRSSPTGDLDGESWKSFLMAGDIGIDWRPVYRRYHLVYEGRYYGNPSGDRSEEVMETVRKRSLYALVDDLPFNTFLMAGYYRPLFGNPVPDHTTLGQRMLAQALQDSPYIYDLNYEAVSIGTAPNVPFLNLHMMKRQFGAKPNDTNRGFAANMGLRFVTLGASVTYSFWNAQRQETVAGEKVTPRVQMHAVTGGMQLWRTTLTSEFIGILKDVPNQAFRKGVVASLDTNTRVWREMYFNLQFANSNISQSLTPGNSKQLRAGFRSFLTPGVDMMLLYGVENMETVATDDGQTDSDLVSQDIQWQLHLYM